MHSLSKLLPLLCSLTFFRYLTYFCISFFPSLLEGNACTVFVFSWVGVFHGAGYHHLLMLQCFKCQFMRVAKGWWTWRAERWTISSRSSSGYCARLMSARASGIQLQKQMLQPLKRLRREKLLWPKATGGKFKSNKGKLLLEQQTYVLIYDLGRWRRRF